MDDEHDIHDDLVDMDDIASAELIDSVSICMSELLERAKSEPALRANLDELIEGWGEQIEHMTAEPDAMH